MMERSGKDVKELELVCVNEEFFGKKKAREMLGKYQKLKSKYPNMVSIKDPEDFEADCLYKEAFVLVPEEDVSKWKRRLERMGIEVDVIHE